MFEKERKIETAIANDEIVSLLNNQISDEVENCFLEGMSLDKDNIKKQIVDTLPHIDAIMLDVRLDEYIKNMEETFVEMEIMKSLIKENPEQRKKMFEDIKGSTEFLLREF